MAWSEAARAAAAEARRRKVAALVRYRELGGGGFTLSITRKQMADKIRRNRFELRTSTPKKNIFFLGRGYKTGLAKTKEQLEINRKMARVSSLSLRVRK